MAVEYHDTDGNLINKGFYRIINDWKGADYEDVAYFSVNSEGDLIAGGVDLS